MTEHKTSNKLKNTHALCRGLEKLFKCREILDSALVMAVFFCSSLFNAEPVAFPRCAKSSVVNTQANTALVGRKQCSSVLLIVKLLI